MRAVRSSVLPVPRSSLNRRVGCSGPLRHFERDSSLIDGFETSKPRGGEAKTTPLKESLSRSREQSQGVERSIDELITKLNQMKQQSQSQSQSQSESQDQQQQGQQKRGNI
jgi:hypothetical protein